MSDFGVNKAAQLHGHTGPVNELAYSSGTGKYLLSCSSDRRINLYNPSNVALDEDGISNTLIQSYTGAHGYEILTISIAKDNSRFASAGSDKTVFIWDVASGLTTRRFGGNSGHTGRVESVTFAGDEDSLIISASVDKSVRLWDIRSQSTRPLLIMTDAKDCVTTVEACEHEIITGGVDGRMRVYDVRMGLVYVDVIAHPITSIASTPQLDALLVTSLDSTLRLMDKKTGKLLRSFSSPGYRNTTYRIRSTFGAKGSLAISGSEDGLIYGWDVVSGNLKARAKHKKKQNENFLARNTVSTVAFNPTSLQWASGGSDGERNTAFIWPVPCNAWLLNISLCRKYCGLEPINSMKTWVYYYGKIQTQMSTRSESHLRRAAASGFSVMNTSCSVLRHHKGEIA